MLLCVKGLQCWRPACLDALLERHCFRLIEGWKREYGICRALPLYPLEVSCQCLYSSHVPLESWTTIQMEAADLNSMKFSSAHYFSGPLYCRSAPFTLCTKLQPSFPAHIWLSQLAAVLARVENSSLVTGLGYVHKGLHDPICSPLIPLSSLLYLHGQAGSWYQSGW